MINMGRVPTVSSKEKIKASAQNALIADYVSQTDTDEQTIARLDHAKFQPISAPAAAEGRLYYDSTAKKLKLRDDTEWLTIPGGGATSGYLHSYDFKVEKEGAEYVVRNKGGTRTYGSAYEELAIKEALDSLKNARTWQEKVLLKGNFPTLDYPSGNQGCIDIEGHTILSLIGKVTLADNVDKNMICSADPTDQNAINVVIEGGTWDGNSSNQASGNNIYWTKSVSLLGVEKNIIFRNLKLIRAKENNLYINNTSGAAQYLIYNIRTYASGAYAFRFFRVFDSHIYNIKPLGQSYWDSCAAIHADLLYQNGGLDLYKCKRLLISNSKFDFTTGDLNTIPVNLRATRNSFFSNIKIKTSGDGADIPAGIRLATVSSTHSHDNIFGNIGISRKEEGTGTREYTYGIEETDANQNYNTYGNINGRDCVTGAIRMLGVNSIFRNIVGKVVIT